MAGPVEQSATISVARGCGFAGLAIACGMVGLSYDPPGALKFGGFATLLACAVLVLMALRSDVVRYKKTETWLLLQQEFRPPAPLAQLIIGRARRRALFTFARINAGFAACCFFGSFMLRAWTGN